MKILKSFLILAATCFSLNACLGVAQESESAQAWSPYVSPVSSSDEMSRLARSEFGGDEAFSTISSRLELQEKVSESGPLGGHGKKGLIQNISVGGSWIPENGANGMGMSEFDTSLTLGLPCPKWGQSGASFFMITPNFSYTNVSWDGPPKFPSSLYSAGLRVGWMKPINERWTFMANVMPSWSSDGKENHDAVRCPGMVGMTWTPNSRWKVVFGAAYLDRSDITVLPYGGFIWTPNDDWRIELMAPQARVAKRLAISNDIFQRWFYVGGGFGGGTWAIESVNDQYDLAMYREYSVLLGYESVKNTSFTWNAEVAYIFGREMEFDRNTQSQFKPDDSLALRLKVSF